MNIEAQITQCKMARIFCLLDWISKDNYSCVVLARKVGTSERTIYRYLTLLAGIGFEVNKICLHDGVTYSLGDKVPNWVTYLKKNI